MARAASVHLKVVDGGQSTSERFRSAERADADLVEAAQAGDRLAEEALARRYIDDITRLVERLLGREAETDDLVQDTFYYAFRDLRRLTSPGAFRGWLFRIAINRVRKAIRRRRLMRLVGLDSSRGSVFLDELAHESVRPEVRSELAALDQALRRLPTERRVAWILRHVEGYGVKDVARLTSCSAATVKRRVAAAQKRIEAAVDVEVLRHG